MSTLLFITGVPKYHTQHRTMGIRIGTSIKSKYLRGVVGLRNGAVSYLPGIPKSPSDTMINLSKKSIT